MKPYEGSTASNQSRLSSLINEFFKKDEKRVPYGYRDRIALTVDENFVEEDFLKDSSESTEETDPKFSLMPGKNDLRH